MAAIITRETAGTGATVAGVPLTNAQLDTNFINLNTELGQKLPLAGGTLSGSRTIKFDTAAGSIEIKGDSGGWGTGLYFVGSGGTNHGGYGALGSADSLTNFWIGPAYNNTWITFSSTEINSKKPFQLEGNSLKFDQVGVRSWSVTATGGNLDVASGDSAGLLRYNGYTIYHSGNIPTWNQNTTGNAATVGNLTPAQFFNNMGNNHGTYTDFNNIPGFGNYYVQAGTNSPTGTGSHQWYGITLGLGNEYSYSQYASQLYWPRAAQNNETYLYIRDRESEAWGSWRKIRAGYADSAGTATDSSKLPLTGGTLTGVLNSSASSLEINTTTPGTGAYQLNFIGQGTSDYAHAITWGWSTSGAQAGIYVQSSGSYGTKMYIATTDSFATGSKTAVTIDHLGNTTLNRGTFQNGSVWINNGVNSNNYNENIRLFNAPNGVSVIAFSASGTGGTPTTSILGYSDRQEVRFNDGWQHRIYNGYIEAAGSFRAPIFYDSGDTGYYIDPASTSNINSLYIQGGVGGLSNSSSYTEAAVEIRERGFGGAQDDTWATAPRLSFHWGGRVASQIAMASSGRISILNNPGNGYEDFQANNIYGTVFYDSADTSYYLDPNSTGTSLQIAGTIEQGNNYAHPNIEWSASGDSTGMVIFYLPGTTSNYGMIHLVFDIYEYNGNAASTVTVGGHNWSTSWYNTSCNVIGQLGHQVRLGSKDGRFVAVFGSSGTVWQYGTIRLRKIHNASFYNNIMDLGGNWSATQTTTESFTSVTGDLRQLRTPATLTAGGYVTGSRLWAGYDSGQANSVSASNWFRSSGSTGWYNATYDGGINMEDTTWVRVYGNKQFYSQNYIQSDSSVRAPIFYDSNDTGYYLDPNSTSNVVAIQSNRYSVGNANAYDHVSNSPWYGLGQSDAAGPWGPGMVQLGGYYGIRHRTAYGVFDIGAPGWGTSWIFSDYNLAVAGQSRSTIHYDYSDTGYYVDPNSTTYLHTLTLSGASYFRPQNWIQLDGSYGLYWPNTNGAHIKANDLSSYGSIATQGSRNGWRGIHIYDGGNTPHLMFDGSANGGIYFETGGRWASYYSYGNNCWGFGTTSTNSAYNIYCPTGVYSGGRSDGTIFYDANDTTYYLDPNSLTSIRTVGSWRSNSSDWDGEFSGKIQYHASHWYFQAAGEWYFRASGGGTVFTCSQGGNVTAAGNITAYSDISLKKNVETIKDPMRLVSRLRGVTFDWIESGKHSYGLIAQEVEQVLPELVVENKPDPESVDKDKKIIKSVDYSKIVSVLIEAVKEQQSQIEELKVLVQTLLNSQK